MRIVHILSSLERGGAQAVLLTIAKARAAQNDQQIVCYFHDGPYRALLHDAGIQTYQIAGLISAYDPLAIYRLYHFLKKFQPDIVHSLLWSANWLARLCCRRLSIACVISLHNNYDQNGIMRNFIDRINSFKGCAIVAVSQQVKKSFYHYQLYDDEILVIENGIAPILPDQKISRHDLGIADDAFVIGSVGRLVPVKRYDCLLDAFAIVHKRYKKSCLLMVGAGPLEENLRNHAQKIGIADCVVWVSNKQAASYYQLMDCFVQSSLKEGISIALLEAMSAGVCCIVAGDNGVHPVVTNGKSGIVACGQKATYFAAAFESILNDIDLRNRISNASQQMVRERFCQDRMIAAYNRLFDEIVQQKK